MCIICLELANNACQTGCCGHILCSGCAGKLKNTHNSCSHCRTSPCVISSDARTKRYISSLTTFCTNYRVAASGKEALIVLKTI